MKKVVLLLVALSFSFTLFSNENQDSEFLDTNSTISENEQNSVTEKNKSKSKKCFL